MQLQKHISKKIKDVEYSKWVIVIPSDQVKELGWQKGTHLESSISNDKIIIKKKS